MRNRRRQPVVADAALVYERERLLFAAISVVVLLWGFSLGPGKLVALGRPAGLPSSGWRRQGWQRLRLRWVRGRCGLGAVQQRFTVDTRQLAAAGTPSNRSRCVGAGNNWTVSHTVNTPYSIQWHLHACVVGRFPCTVNGLGTIALACKVCKKAALVCTSGRSIDRFHPLGARCCVVLTYPARGVHGPEIDVGIDSTGYYTTCTVSTPIWKIYYTPSTVGIWHIIMYIGIAGYNINKQRKKLRTSFFYFNTWG